MAASSSSSIHASYKDLRLKLNMLGERYASELALEQDAALETEFEMDQLETLIEEAYEKFEDRKTLLRILEYVDKYTDMTTLREISSDLLPYMEQIIEDMGKGRGIALQLLARPAARKRIITELGTSVSNFIRDELVVLGENISDDFINDVAGQYIDAGLEMALISDPVNSKLIARLRSEPENVIKLLQTKLTAYRGSRDGNVNKLIFEIDIPENLALAGARLANIELVDKALKRGARNFGDILVAINGGWEKEKSPLYVLHSENRKIIAERLIQIIKETENLPDSHYKIEEKWKSWKIYQRAHGRRWTHLGNYMVL